MAISQKQKALLKIGAAIVVGTLAIWALWPAALTTEPLTMEETPTTPGTVEGEVGDESPIDVNAPADTTDEDATAVSPTDPASDPTPATPEGAKLPAPNSAELVRLHEEALAGNRESLEEVCKYVNGADLYDLGDFQPDEELSSACAELQPSEPGE